MNASSSVVVTKLAAATRLLEAGIKMFFRSDDMLAVHVVASAVFRVLTDVAETRGYDPLEDGLKLGLYYLGRDYLDRSMPDWARIDDTMSALAKEIGNGIEAGEITGPGDVVVQIPAAQRRRFWGEFNASYNFLKHAQRDILNVVEESDLNTEATLTSACRVFDILFPDHANRAVCCYQFFGVWKAGTVAGPLWMQRMSEQVSGLDEEAVRGYLLDVCDGSSAIRS